MLQYAKKTEGYLFESDSTWQTRQMERVMCGGRIIGKLQRDFVENGRGEAVKLGSTAVFSVEI